MATIEDGAWSRLVKAHLAASPTAHIAKAEQQALASALQEWTAHCILQHLETLLQEQAEKAALHRLQGSGWQIHHRGKDFLGAVRWQEVDVWLANPEAGLVLAVDPKHFQSRKSLDKNWKNGHNDLVAFATNLHERFPGCAVGGVLAFPEWAATSQQLKQIHTICNRSIPREKPLNAYGKFEGFGVAVYDSKGNLVWPFAPASPLRPNNAFAALAHAVYVRTVASL
jgi:hypothetical protein